MTRPLKIGIAGAGIGGLAAACFLARDGHDVTLFDQFEQAGPVGSGLMLQETGLAVLGALSLRDAALRHGAPIHRLHGIATDTGRAVLDVRYAALRESLIGLGIQRAALFQLLFDAALAQGGQLVTGTTIARLGEDARTFRTSESENLGPFDVLVDALGANSPLSDKPAKPLPFGALWATLPWDHTLGFNDTALEQRYRAASRMAGVMPSGRLSEQGEPTLTYFWSIRTGAYEAWRQAPLADWKDEARRLWPETEPLLDRIGHHDALTYARYVHRTHKRPVEGRLVHLGDSWHATSPQLGQGGNMALLDAYALALALKADGDLPARLARYARLRTGHVRLYQAMSFLFTPVYQSDSKILPWFRDRVAARLSRIWPAPPLLAAMVAGVLGRPLKRLRSSRVGSR